MKNNKEEQSLNKEVEFSEYKYIEEELNKKIESAKEILQILFSEYHGGRSICEVLDLAKEMMKQITY